MTDDNEQMKLVFAPGCFDNFEGTQEELDSMQAEIMQMFESGEFFDNAEAVDMDALFDEEPELAAKLMEGITAHESTDEPINRKLH
jgi:hypothetical protein